MRWLADCALFPGAMGVGEAGITGEQRIEIVGTASRTTWDIHDSDFSYADWVGFLTDQALGQGNAVPRTTRDSLVSESSYRSPG